MKKLILYLHLTRWKNLLLLVFSLLLFKYRVFPFFKTTSLLTNLEFFLLLMSVVCIAMGGYIINDIYDIECDRINKPKKAFIPLYIDLLTAKFLYRFSTALGFLCGLSLCISIHETIYILSYIVIIAILYFYTLHLKTVALLGNITTSLLISFNLILFVLLDSNIQELNQGIYLTLLFSVFAFFLNFIREVIKDIEDIKGDYNAGLKTLPILIGTERTVKFILIFSLIPTYLLINFGTQELTDDTPIQLFYWTFIIAPFFLYIYKTYTARSKHDFRFISQILKFILTFGLILIYLITIEHA